MRFPLFQRAQSPEPDRIEVAHGAARYPVALRRSVRARRITLRILNGTDEIVLTVPQRARLADAMRFAQAHGGWIAARLARRPGPVTLADGVVFPLRGVPHRIVHSGPARQRPEPGCDSGGAAILGVGGDPAFIGKRVREFLQAQARRDLADAVARHTAALGLPARRVTLRDTRSRWGSCTARGDLNFSWRLVMAPPFVLDYLAAHEVAHLREMNHSIRFWRVVESLFPGYEEAEAWLKRHGADLHRYR